MISNSIIAQYSGRHTLSTPLLLTFTMPDLPSHASPFLAPQPLSAAHSIAEYTLNSGHATPSLPDNLLSPAFTPPATPGLVSGATTPSRREPKSIPVDSSTLTSKPPRLLERLPHVECIVRARIPTVSGAEMFLHLYQNDSDDKEHLAIVFGNDIRSRSLDAPRPGETEMDRMIRGAYTGRLHPGRTSSRVESILSTSSSSIKPSAALDRRKPLSSVPSTVQEEETLNSTSNPTSNPVSHPITLPKAPLVRIHSECYTGETAWSARCDCGEQLDEAARLMSLPSSTPSPGGVIVYLRQEGRGIGLGEKLKAYNLQDLGSDTVEANLLLRHPADARSYGLATAILVDLGLSDIRLLTNNPDKVRAVEGPGREVVVRERVPMVPLAWKTGGKGGIHSREIEEYLNTKVSMNVAIRCVAVTIVILINYLCRLERWDI